MDTLCAQSHQGWARSITLGQCPRRISCHVMHSPGVETRRARPQKIHGKARAVRSANGIMPQSGLSAPNPCCPVVAWLRRWSMLEKWMPNRLFGHCVQRSACRVVSANLSHRCARNWNAPGACQQYLLRTGASPGQHLMNGQLVPDPLHVAGAVRSGLRTSESCSRTHLGTGQARADFPPSRLSPRHIPFPTPSSLPSFFLHHRTDTHPPSHPATPSFLSTERGIVGAGNIRGLPAYYFYVSSPSSNLFFSDFEGNLVSAISIPTAASSHPFRKQSTRHHGRIIIRLGEQHLQYVSRASHHQLQSRLHCLPSSTSPNTLGWTCCEAFQTLPLSWV